MRDDERWNTRHHRTLKPEKARKGHEKDEIATRNINVIARCFARGGATKSARKRYLQEVLSLSSEKMKKMQRLSSTPEMTFRALT